MHFIAMEYIEGTDLRAYICSHGPLSERELQRWLLPVIDALAYAHRQGMVHRDIKSANILLEEGTGRAVLTDFGIARAADSGHLTQTGTVLGTPEYMSPEQAQGEKTDKQSDIFSFGIVLYEALTGTLPFQGESILGILNKIAREEAVPISERRPGVSRHLVEAVEGCLVKERMDRISRCEELLGILQGQRGKVNGVASKEKSHEANVKETPVGQRGAEARRSASPETVKVRSDVGFSLGKPSKHSHALEYFLGLLIVVVIGMLLLLITRNVGEEHGKVEEQTGQAVQVRINPSQQEGESGTPGQKQEQERASAQVKPQVADVEVARRVREQKQTQTWEDPVAERTKRAGEARKQNHVGMIYVEGGTFLMGSETSAYDQFPIHQVTLLSFYLDKTEVTVKAYKEFCRATSRTMPPPPSWGWQDDHPVVNVSWYDAHDYAKWKRKRLPTEAEWEFAAKGGNRSWNYHYAGAENPDSVAWYSANSDGQTHPVGGKQPNELGLYDMSGNAWEWVSDGYSSDYYKKSPVDNPHGPPSVGSRVLRGGSWCNDPISLLATYRWGWNDAGIYSGNGFRCARDKN